MTIPFKIISVFLSSEFNFWGNTSAVVELPEPVGTEDLQHLASDLNQPATSFFWREDNKIKTRWFAPDGEIDLCGHGTLAILAYLNKKDETALHYKNGLIKGFQNTSNTYTMILDQIPSYDAGDPDEAIVNGLKTSVEGYYANTNKNIVLLPDEQSVRRLEPDFSILKKMKPFGIIATARGEEVDFVSRTFVPKVQQLEDHATGSSHAALTPFWAEKLKKKKMTAHQLSPRGGKFICELHNQKVMLTGEAREIAGGFIPNLI